MNWLLIVVGVIFLVSIVAGMARGAVKIIVSLAATLVTLALTVFLTPYVADAVTKYTPLYDVIEEHVSGAMTDAAMQYLTGGDGMPEEASGTDSQEPENVLEGAEIPRDLQTEAIQSADLPELFKHLLAVNNNSEVYQQLGAETFVQYVGSYLARLLINIIAFLCSFLLITIIVRAVVFALDFVASLPGVGFLNRLAGGVLGILGALIIVWTLYIIITLLYTTSFGKELFQMIQSDQFLSMLYEYNPIMKLAITFR